MGCTCPTNLNGPRGCAISIHDAEPAMSICAHFAGDRPGWASNMPFEGRKPVFRGQSEDEYATFRHRSPKNGVYLVHEDPGEDQVGMAEKAVSL